MKATATSRAASPLGIGLLAYFLFVIVVITLLPFRFQWPTRLHVLWRWELFDTVANVCLFLPLGFLARLVWKDGCDRWGLRVIGFGMAFSVSLELVQLCLRGRYSSLVDVLANGLGTWIGILLYDGVERRLTERLVGQLALELPLMGLFYLLIPLLWLDGFAIGSHVSRLWFAPLLGLCGGSLLAAVWMHRLRPAGVLSANALTVVAGVWFLIGSLPGFVKRPGFLVLCSVGIGLAVRLLVAWPWLPSGSERRFELSTLRRIGPLYMIYMGLLALWPWFWAPGPWSARLGFAEVADRPGVIPTLRELEYIAAFTLFGYMMAEYRGRHDEPLPKILLWLLVCGTVGGGWLEVARGFHPIHVASLAHLTVAIGATLYGGILYRLQLAAVQRLRTQDVMPEAI
jgi:glycopeptide antibiotics resistance protein